MNLDNYELVKAVNSAITGRRDHRAAYKRFIALTPGQQDVFCKGLHAMATSAKDLKSFKEDIAAAWGVLSEEDMSGYFFDHELAAIEAVIGRSW